ncbi:MAG: Rv3654c family TadE-like protein [Marmoricola sp.]
MSDRRTPGEAGAATVFALALLALLVVVALACAVAVAALAGHRHAEAAADLAALAAAQALQRADDACGAAAQVATANGARLDDCALEGTDVVVEVHVLLPGVGRLLGPGAVPALPARARAGPAR